MMWKADLGYTHKTEISCSINNTEALKETIKSQHPIPITGSFCEQIDKNNHPEQHWHSHC